MPLTPEAVLAYIAEHGPAVPNHIRQALGAQDNFVVGAVLSELAASGKLALTRLSYGTSKFYYDPKHPELLEALGAHLGEKDQRAFALLKEERVVRHSELSPLNRVAMAAIGDFSRLLPVETPVGEERFWRYYLVSEDDAFDLIVTKWFPSHTPKATAQPAAFATVIESTEPVSKLAAETPTSAPEASEVKPTLIPASQAATLPKASDSKRKRARKSTSKSSPASASSATKVKSRAPSPPSEFSQGIVEYFSVRNIRLDEDLGSSKTELAAIVRVPSAIGEMRYYCKAKTKKVTTDGDLASAFLDAQQRGLPLLYLAAGTLSKKAQEALPTLKGAIIAKPFSAAGEENY